MRNKTFFAVGAAAALFLSACNLEDLLEDGTGSESTQDQVVRGLRTALSAGIDTGAALAGRANGYLAHAVIKILLPEDARQALAAAEEAGAYLGDFRAELQAMNTAVKLAGLESGAYTSNLARAATALGQAADLEHLGDSLVKYMNRGGEMAAPRSVPIFKSAIASMTISDGLTLLNSDDSTAATGYLNGKTFVSLNSAYAPLVDSTLALVPLTEYWGDFRSAYNSLLANYRALLDFQASWNANALVSTVPALRVDALGAVEYRPIETESLGAWTTEKALTGLFWLVGEEEKEIRRDPFGYAKGLAAGAADLLEKVFGEIMEMGTAPRP